ncbi:uncharacterized protein ACBR49_002160 [Aulostomus maculatus]
MDSAGYTCDLLRGRVVTTQRNGWIEFKISNGRLLDGGYYRCSVLGADYQIYTDYYVEVSEVSDHYRETQPLPTTTIKALSTSGTPPSSTGPALARDHSDTPIVPWSFGLLVAAIVSITVMVLIASVIGVVCFRVKAKPKQLDKCGETLCESLKQEAPETAGVVYTTVDFRPKTTELYANVRMHQTQTGLDSTRSTEYDGMVEYSTLAIHQ